MAKMFMVVVVIVVSLTGVIWYVKDREAQRDIQASKDLRQRLLAIDEMERAFTRKRMESRYPFASKEEKAEFDAVDRANAKLLAGQSLTPEELKAARFWAAGLDHEARLALDRIPR